jgi:hypothetical protein
MVPFAMYSLAETRSKFVISMETRLILLPPMCDMEYDCGDGLLALSGMYVFD